MIQRILLTGFSGTGKSTTAALIADRLGWSAVDMDDELERRYGMKIPEMFSRQGEAWFRDREAELLRELCSRDRIVVSTGGGAVCSNHAWDVISSSRGTLAVGFDASAEEIDSRLREHSSTAEDGKTTERPMLAGAEPLQRIRDLLQLRTPFYQRADVHIPVGNRLPERTAGDVAELGRLGSGTFSTVDLRAASGDSTIHVGPGAADQLVNELHQRWPSAQRLWIGADEHVLASQADWIDSVGQSAGLRVEAHAIPSGEGSKSLAGMGDLYDWMLGSGVQRGDVMVALGGGVVGDLVGFAAATTLRGIGLVQIPTTLLSMVDSSVGGKTGINHPRGKNLIGAFYQPPLVLVDSRFLSTLPDREFRSGFGEIVKHGVIQASVPGQEGGFLLDTLERNGEALLRKEEPALSWVLRQNIALKAAVVAADERETTLRQILNFGHTIGHGIEAAGYQLLHGEAVAVGMVAVLNLAGEIGIDVARIRERVVSLLQQFGLPTSAHADPDTVMEKMQSDKKKAAGVQQWVLPVAAGGVEIRTGIPESAVRRAIESVTEH